MKQGLIAKRPKGPIKSYSVVPYTRDAAGKKIYGEALKHDSLQQLNQMLKSGELTATQAAFHFENVVLPDIKKRSKVQDRVLVEAQISEENLRWFNKLWSKHFEKRDIVHETAKYGFLKALRAIEPLSLVSSSQEEMQARLNKAFKEPAAHKKYGNRLNQLLTFVGRNFKLQLKRVPPPNVKYISWDEFLEVRANIFVFTDNQKTVDEEATAAVRSLCTFLFGTGCRFGEAFTFRTQDLKANRSLYVQRQLKRNGLVDETKNHKPHYTLLLPQAAAAFKEWTSVPNKERYRGSIVYRAFKRAVRTTFKDKARQVTVHDLRHCYVIHMLGLGVPLDKVAKLIGDTVKTCEMHYAGFVASDAEIDFIDAIVRKSTSS